MFQSISNQLAPGLVLWFGCMRARLLSLVLSAGGGVRRHIRVLAAYRLNGLLRIRVRAASAAEVISVGWIIRLCATMIA